MERYEVSIRQLSRAEKTIPLGSQTFSKSRIQYPVGISPLFLDRAKDCRVWDIDGNEYIDLVSSLAAITIGYGDKKIAKAIRKQLAKGVLLSLPGVLEAEVAEMIVQMVPSAEMVRFGKNGTDATSAAIRLARAFTGRDHIIVCGYHGWQDWYIGSTTRDKGVPKSVSALTHKFEFNNIKSLESILEKLSGQVAAVIMEPMNNEFPIDGFLKMVKEITNKAGALLVFDETITGFRFARGGAQELFGVTPDISTFGKGLANGFPVSAVVGRRDVMMEMEEIFFSGTFGGELLSLAAAKTVLETHLSSDVAGELNRIGKTLTNEVNLLISKFNLQDVLRLSGHPTWTFLNWSPTSKYTVDQIKTFFMQEIFKRGVLVLNTHNVTLAHSDSVIHKIAAAYDGTLSALASAIKNERLAELLQAEPLKSLFKLR
jgi:glutamate-1-semialdehyde 2,1-aminomutase